MSIIICSIVLSSRARKSVQTEVSLSSILTEVSSTMPALAGGSLPVLGSGKIEQLKLKISNVKTVQPSFLAVHASTVKIVTSNPGFGINYFFLADIKHH